MPTEACAALPHFEHGGTCAAVNGFEENLVRSGTILIKYWLDIVDETQEARFTARIHDPRTRWKLGPMDLEARARWVDYSRARDDMLLRTDSPHAPRYIVDANTKRHARLNVIEHLLSLIPYEDLTPPPRRSNCPFVHRFWQGWVHDVLPCHAAR